MSEADQIWGRVGWDGNGWIARRPGDRALADVLRAHNETFHGGIPHVVEALSSGEMDAAIDGFRYFDLEDAAEVLHEARTRLRAVTDTEADALEERLNEMYWAVIPDDQTLLDALERRHAEDPTAFAPLKGIWGTDP